MHSPSNCFQLAVYMSFVAALTVFVTDAPNPAAFPEYYGNDSFCTFSVNVPKIGAPPLEESRVQNYSRWITMVLIITEAFFELFQAFRVCCRA